ncbi:hypothetical protein PRZ48_013349 [Zasmidium cellare]|uniref:Uncharacterized protein n=1 Tax=Zasmidium cellare TaxID=395010 RepID=A0ABR0E0S3_ZASCE|nr:hypothetical protein PRZ48_013349 [Zasmidium cellare]
MFSKKQSFQPLPTTDEEEESVHYEVAGKAAAFGGNDSKWRPLIRHGAALLVLFVVTVLGLALVATWASRTNVPKPTWSSCGSDPETARSRGCSFDLISFAWQTPECFDADLVSEFASWEGDWTFFADDKFTQPVDQSVASQGERTPLFVPWDYHIVHCTFMWRQMHRAYENGWIDEHLGNYNHTLHCQKMTLMDEKAAEKAVTVARIIFPECRRPDVVDLRYLSRKSALRERSPSMAVSFKFKKTRETAKSAKTSWLSSEPSKNLHIKLGGKKKRGKDYGAEGTLGMHDCDSASFHAES